MKKTALSLVALLTATTAFATEATQAPVVSAYKPGIMSYLTLAPEDQTYTAKQDANIRIGPNTAFDVAGTIHKGDIIESVGRARSWVAFEKDGQTVFVWEGLLNPWKAWPSTTVQTSE